MAASHYHTCPDCGDDSPACRGRFCSMEQFIPCDACIMSEDMYVFTDADAVALDGVLERLA